MNNQVTLQDAAKIIDRLGRYFPMLVRNGSEVVNDWYPFIAQFPLDVAQLRRCMLLKTPPLIRLSLLFLCRRPECCCNIKPDSVN